MNVNEVINSIAYDEKIAKCLLCADPNFENYVLPENAMDNLAWNYIFPYSHIPKTTDIAKCFITMDFEYANINNTDKFIVGQVVFYAFCHESMIRTDYDDLRYNYLFERIKEIIKTKRFINCVGKMNFVTRKDFSIADADREYFGSEITYRNVEFM
jgi:hypothetical protein